MKFGFVGITALVRRTPYKAATEVDTKSPGNAKTLRITLYAQNLGRFPKVGLGLAPGLLTPTSVVS